MREILGRLVEYENKYHINHKRQFKSIDVLELLDVKTCFEFAYEMSFGRGEHRNYRSGGDVQRTSGEIFVNTFQGKMAEFAMYRYLRKYGIQTTYPDLSIEGLGTWDEFDLEYEGLHMTVKSTKYYGNLLLLETKDWNEEGKYIPNMECGIVDYDYFILLRIAPDGQSIMKEQKMLYSNYIEKEELGSLIYSVKWQYDIAGYITRKDLVRLISKKYILPKGAMLGNGTVMDAENYYVQAGDMRKGEELVKRLLGYKLIEKKFQQADA